MGAKDLAEKNLLQYKDVFSDIVNVNLFGGRCYVSAEELSQEPGELINTLYHCLLADNRMEDIQKAIMDTEYQKELLREYGIGE